MADDRLIDVLRDIADALTSSGPTTMDDARACVLEFGGRVRTLRQDRELSMAKLAQWLDIDEPMLSRIERGITIPSVELTSAIEAWMLREQS